MTQPAFPISYPSINGTRHSWAQVEAKFNGQLIRGFTAIKYADELKIGWVRGTASQPIDRTLGDYETSGCSFDMLLAEADNFLQAITNNGQRGWGMVSFPITSQFLANGLQTITDQLIGCRITKVGNDVKPSTDGLVRTIEFMPMLILLNGLFALDPANTLQGNGT
jgi:hypothetical protein